MVLPEVLVRDLRRSKEALIDTRATKLTVGEGGEGDGGGGDGVFSRSGPLN